MVLRASHLNWALGFLLISRARKKSHICFFTVRVWGAYCWGCYDRDFNMQNIQDKREFEAAIQALEAQAVNVGLHMVVDA